MSVIIGYIKNGVTYLATDTRVIDDDRKRNEVCACNFKLRKLDNGIIYGVTNSKYIRQFLMANEDMFTPDTRGNLTVQHIVMDILPTLYFSLKEAKLLDNDKGEPPFFSSSILIGFKGKLFEICSDFSVFRYEKYQAIGPLSDYALTKVSNIDEKEEINRQLIDAMRICAKNTEYVGGPYLTINTDELKYELTEED